MPASRPVDVYVRVSRVSGRDGERFQSPAAQEDACRRWASLHGYTVGRVLTDLDASGGTNQRPGLQTALERVERGESGGIVAARLDRLARSIVGLHAIIQRVDNAGGTVASVAESMDVGSATGRLVLNVLASLASFERERATEGWDQAHERAIARGAFNGPAPFGYVADDAGCLVPDPEAVPLVREAFERRAAGASWTELARFLNEHTTTTRGGQWSARTVRHMIQRRAYLGESYHGEHRNPDAHDALVDVATWQAAQRASERATTPRRGTASLLAGLVRCAGCGRAMKSQLGGSGANRSRSYRCAGSSSAGECPAPAYASAAELDALVIGHARTWSRAATFVQRGDDGGLAAAERALAAAENELGEYLSDIELRAAVSRDAYLAGAAKRQAAVDRASATVESVQQDDRAADEIVNAADAWPTNPAGQAAWLRRVLDGVYVKRREADEPTTERAVIFWRGEGPQQLRKGEQGVGLMGLEWPPVSPMIASIPRWAWRYGHEALPEDLRQAMSEAATRKGAAPFAPSERPAAPAPTTAPEALDRLSGSA